MMGWGTYILYHRINCHNIHFGTFLPKCQCGWVLDSRSPPLDQRMCTVPTCVDPESFVRVGPTLTIFF